MYFKMEYIDYWLQTRDGQLSTAQATAKFNGKFLSQYQYVRLRLLTAKILRNTSGCDTPRKH
jgi:hypothetical protein